MNPKEQARRLAIVVAVGTASIAGGVRMWQELDQTQDSQIVSSWSGKIIEKLDGTTPLAPSENRYDQVKIVPAGNTYEELVEMRAKGSRVSVRNYPGTYLPNGGTTKVIGQVDLGTNIHDVLLTQGTRPRSPEVDTWGVFRCGDIQGPIFGKKGNPIKPDPNKVCAINSDYLEATLTPLERLESTLSLMEQSSIPQVRETAQRYYALLNSPQSTPLLTDGWDSTKFGSGPVSLLPIGGGLDGKRLVVLPIFSMNELSGGDYTPADIAVFLVKADMHAQMANSSPPGTASARLDYMRQIEAIVWQEVWATLGSEFGDRVSNPYLRASWQAYLASNQNPAVTQK